jgi:hypothetical protein
MPKKEPLPPISHNLKPLLKEIKDAIGRLDALDDRRSNASADKKAIIEQLEKKGIHKDALRMAMMYAAWPETKRLGFDTAYELVRDAEGVPVQGSLDLGAKQAAK